MNLDFRIENKDIEYLRMAVEVSRCAPPKLTAFSVGCVIADRDGSLVSTGFSREWGDHWHAEATAIEKGRQAAMPLTQCTLYTSLEPCSVRKSGRETCCNLILRYGIRRVVFGLREPPLFVQCNAVETLLNAGVEIVEIVEFNTEVVKINAHLGLMMMP
jgi:diaminohydroxyphosphoribosylaminopyrimidine deaminase / 5-amino-6-(5-phosphoribosylamino)uracil reductase